MIRSRHNIDEYLAGIRERNRTVLGQAITLIESQRQDDQQAATDLLDRIMPYTGNSIRIGITGVPGVGKSTFIEALGKLIIADGKTLAVLTVDPSSQRTKGSILGDKTRMEDLAKDPNAFIRPTASGSSIGGVASKTREAILLCEGAGYEVIIVETIGVGQSESAVKSMVDFFLLLMLAGAGDELQGIKKGIMEMADAIVITKADGDNIQRTTHAQAAYQQALHLFSTQASAWQTKVLTCSALTGRGIKDVWKIIQQYKHAAVANNFFETNREHQNIAWLHEHFDQLIKTDLHKNSSLSNKIEKLEKAVRDKKISAYAAAHELKEAYYKTIGRKS